MEQFAKLIAATSIIACGSLGAAAHAHFHLMQIEQVIGGVNGHSGRQAIQLRMRAPDQNVVSAARLVARDANGANPVLIIDMTTDVLNAAEGDRVLITSAVFDSATSPPTVADFTMTNQIPFDYLAAGSLTFEDDGGTVLWRFSWGGASYVGPCDAYSENDDDGNACPAFAGPLNSYTKQAVKFQGSASAMSTTNAADYALTQTAATFTNNDGATFTIVGPDVGACCLQSGDCINSQMEFDCEGKFGGQFLGPNTVCDGPFCDPPATGACCLPDGGGCSPSMTQNNCTNMDGTYLGDGQPCPKEPCPPPCPEDSNGDGTVNVVDLLAVIANWGTPDGDLNGDGTTNVVDLLQVIANWGPC